MVFGPPWRLNSIGGSRSWTGSTTPSPPSLSLLLLLLPPVLTIIFSFRLAQLATQRSGLVEPDARHTRAGSAGPRRCFDSRPSRVAGPRRRRQEYQQEQGNHHLNPFLFRHDHHQPPKAPASTRGEPRCSGAIRHGFFLASSLASFLAFSVCTVLLIQNG